MPYVMCCENASENHHKLVVAEKAKKQLSFKGTKTNSIPIHSYNQKGAWRDLKKVIPEALCSRNSDFPKRGLPQKTLLLQYNTPSHPRETVLSSNNDLIFIKLLLLNVTAIIQTMGQALIVSVKRHSQADS
jgi:hypothetical protein